LLHSCRVANRCETRWNHEVVEIEDQTEAQLLACFPGDNQLWKWQVEIEEEEAEELHDFESILWPHGLGFGLLSSSYTSILGDV